MSLKIDKLLVKLTKNKEKRFKLLKSEMKVGTLLLYYRNKKDYKRIL